MKEDLTRQYAGSEQDCGLCHTPGVVGTDLEAIDPTPEPLRAPDEAPFTVAFRCRDRDACRRRVQAGP